MTPSIVFLAPSSSMRPSWSIAQPDLMAETAPWARRRRLKGSMGYSCGSLFNPEDNNPIAPMLGCGFGVVPESKPLITCLAALWRN